MPEVLMPEDKGNVDLNSFTGNLNVALFIISLVLGFSAIAVYSCRIKTDESINGICSELILVALASLIIGSILGFLFGMPKTSQSSDKKSKNTIFLINTNLEEISDWLTKIIVGLGLIQLKSLPQKLNILGVTFQKNIGNGKINDIGMVAICIMIYFILFGFLSLYMYTRINLSYQFLVTSVEQEKLTAVEVSKPIEALNEDKLPKTKIKKVI